MDTSPQLHPANPQNDPITAAVVAAAQAPQAAPQHIYVHHSSRGSFFGRLFAWAGWFGFAMCFFMLISMSLTMSDYFDTTGGVTEKFRSGDETSYIVDKVAVINISGVILEGEGYVKRQIDRVLKDDAVKAVVVRVDSPGGTVTGSDYIYHHLKEMKKEKDIPVVVSMGSMAASGGYYVSMAVGDQEKAIYAEPTTTTGSIGVIIPHYDISGLMERFDVKDNSISSHPRKQMLSMTRELPDEHREIIQGYVNESFERFKDIVKEGRPKFRTDGEALTKLATGEIFSADQAKKLGLVDEIGFIEEAIERAVELAGLDSDKVRVVEYERPVALFDLAGLMHAKQPSLDLATLLDLSAPRAYYLATSLPTLMTSKRAD